MKRDSKIKYRKGILLLSALLVLALPALAGCGPSEEDLQAVDYTPVQRDDWKPAQ